MALPACMDRVCRMVTSEVVYDVLEVVRRPREEGGVHLTLQLLTTMPLHEVLPQPVDAQPAPNEQNQTKGTRLEEPSGPSRQLDPGGRVRLCWGGLREALSDGLHVVLDDDRWRLGRLARRLYRLLDDVLSPRGDALGPELLLRQVLLHGACLLRPPAAPLPRMCSNGVSMPAARSRPPISTRTGVRRHRVVRLGITSSAALGRTRDGLDVVFAASRGGFTTPAARPTEEPPHRHTDGCPVKPTE
mmetsp:Transcript_44276/g.125240  ORF Transcript_44276/g.125240 Transcript_44276/m.125240 type:complete len:245 (+) Transcript_44276:748-1482(+)